MIWAAAGFLAMATALPSVVMVDRPVTVVVPVPDTARQEKVVLLRMAGVIMRRDAPAMWNVFWEKQDEAHLIGYISSPANTAARNPRPANFILELPAAASAAVRRQKEMRFMFAPVQKLPQGGVTITSVRLE